MSETGSIGGGPALKGWSQATGSLRAGGREDLDVSRSSTRSHESYSSANALRQPLPFGQLSGTLGEYPGARRSAPSSSPNLYALPSSVSRLERPGSVSSGGSPSQGLSARTPNLEEQLKQERSWWSVHMMGETHEVERNVKEELHKTVNALREKFMDKLETQRNDAALRTAQLERSIGNLGTQIDALRERLERQDGGGAAAAAALAPQLQQLRGEVTDSDRTMRLELSRVSASIEDFHRVQGEIMNTLQLQQSKLEADAGVSSRLQEEVRILDERLRSEEARRGADVDRAMQSLTARFDSELQAALADERAARLRELEGVRDEARRHAQDLLEQTMRAPVAAASGDAAESAAAVSAAMAKVEDLRRLIEAERTSRKAEVDGLRADLTKERDVRNNQLNDAHKALREELAAQRPAEAPRAGPAGNLSMEAEVRFTELEAALDHAKQAWKLQLDASRSATSEEMRQAVASALAERDAALPASLAEFDGDTAKTLREICDVLQAEVRKRTAEADELRSQICSIENVVMERSGAEGAQESILSNVAALDDRLSAVARDLDNERETRRGDVERVQLLIQDVNETIRDEKKLRGHELEKCRQALADLATNVQAAVHDEPGSDQGRGLKILAAVRSILDGEFVAGSDSDKLYGQLAASGGSAKRHADTTAQLSDLTAAFGKEVTDVLARVQGLRGELRAEFAAKLQATSDELRQDIGASCADVHGSLMTAIESVANARPVGSGEWAGGANLSVERKAEMLGNLTEVTKIVKIISETCDHLGQRLQSESTQRRVADGSLDVRITSMEKRLSHIGGGEEVLLPAEREELRLLEGQVSGLGAEPPQQQHLARLQHEAQVSENLKNSFDKLLGRLNNMLWADDGVSGTASMGGLASGLATPASQRGGIRTPMSIASSIGGTLTPSLQGVRGSSGLPVNVRMPERQRSSVTVRVDDDAGSAPSLPGQSAKFTAMGPQRFVEQQPTNSRQREMQELQVENAILREELAATAQPGQESPKTYSRTGRMQGSTAIPGGAVNPNAGSPRVGQSQTPSQLPQQRQQAQPQQLPQQPQQPPQQQPQQSVGSGSSQPGVGGLRVRPVHATAAAGQRPTQTLRPGAPGMPQRAVSGQPQLAPGAAGIRAVAGRPGVVQVRPGGYPAMGR